MTAARVSRTPPAWRAYFRSLTICPRCHGIGTTQQHRPDDDRHAPAPTRVCDRCGGDGHTDIQPPFPKPA